MFKTMAMAASMWLVLSLGTAQADNTWVTKDSSYDVTTTLDRLEQVLESKGIGVMARIDHQQNAESVDLELRPTQVLIFGNPKVGTLVMQANQNAAIDLPMKVLAYEKENGDVCISYLHPHALANRWGLDHDHAAIQKMTAALDNLTNAALE